MKRTILILVCMILAGSTAHAMRPRAQSLMAVARNMAQTRISCIDLKARAGDGSYNERERFEQDEAHSGRYLIPAAIGLGLGIDQQGNLDEALLDQVYTIDVYNIKTVLNILNTGSYDEKRSLVQKITEKIENYPIADLVQLLQGCPTREHHALMKSIVQKFTLFPLKSISEILFYDKHEHTQDLLASGLAKHAKQYMGTHFWGVNKQGIKDFAKAFHLLEPNFKLRIQHALCREYGLKDDISTCDGTQLFEVLKEYPVSMQKIIVPIFFEGKHSFNKGDMVQSIDDYLAQRRVLINKCVTQEFNLSEQDWQEINKLCTEIMPPDNIKSDHAQIIYECDLDLKIKNCIEDICKKRGIKGEMKVLAQPYDFWYFLKSSFTAASMGINEAQIGYRHILTINKQWIASASNDDVISVLEHEIGGHAAHYHAYFVNALAYYLVTIKRIELNSIKRSLSYALLRTFYEFEADLVSAVHDDDVAKTCKHHLERRIDSSPSGRGGIYMSTNEHYQAIMAIRLLKKAAKQWFDSSEAYHVYGSPAYDAFDYNENAKDVHKKH